ncbi:G-type lectin S-receptor-like serine/threonine-protein kinase At1g11410 [Euphorbia lathyris]|uniref:G-type lectin S-receptor-like serine/threonine-protein kinase At1g11410 n=1 Tax=Euphorbia lathyris TaxID=212925 RepID=UPI003313D291
MNQLEISLSSLIFFLILNFTISIDTLTPTQPLRDGDVLVSSGEAFALGFFSPGKSPRRFVGIWYNKVSELTVVWVANRDTPINDTTGILTIDGRGNLVLYENNKTDVPLWASNVNDDTTSSKAQLLDSGNLVLLDQKNSSRILWESFDFPTDTLLPYMKLGRKKNTGKNWSLSSWKSPEDPGTGNIFYKIDPVGFPQLFLYKGPARIWRGGPWTGKRWSGVPEMTRSFIFNTSFVNTDDEVYVLYGVTNGSIFTRMMVNESGVVQRATWNGRGWIGFWSAPKELCDNYGECGANSNCDPFDSDNFICKCLPGFEPKSPRDWYLRDGSDGCVRNAGVSTCRSGEGFVKMTIVRIPDTAVARADMSMGLKACEEECLKNCSCTAYTSADERGIGCLSWYGDLIDTRQYSSVGQDLYIRVDAAELAKYRKSKGPLANEGVQALVIVSVAVISFLTVFLIYYIIIKRRKARDRRHRNKFLFNFINQDSESGKRNDDEGGIPDLPFFHLNDIAEATNNFSDDNKLGEGGFGSVYKGVLHDGKEIAVKRLSKHSGQGSNEFRNEVALIAKLQHRNLVKMIGYCIHHEEKMLIYEYLPNKSLDTFIFDEAKRKLINWSMRHEIICGIARGILYLHQDSRLKIIHRDLKASNVLLDALMKPKISDFGMARIFGVDQIEAETHRVVGTYGYMSPEYAMQGLFSVKSDVYSFGVLLIEIISGRKNSSFYDETTSSNLVGYVWELWKEGRSLEIVDISLGESYKEEEVRRCIQIGLLCVQESAADRPTMFDVVFMLTNDTILPSPNQPAFIMKRTYTSGDPSTTSGATNSLNDLTVTTLHPR